VTYGETDAHVTGVTAVTGVFGEGRSMTAKTRPTCERFRLLVEVRADGVPAVATLRRALKCLLRAFGVKAIRVEAAPPRPARATAAAPTARGSVSPPDAALGRSEAVHDIT
jgi:hypothetical protein